MLAPAADLWHALVFLNEAKAGSLSAKNMVVLLVNLSLGLSVMCFVRALNSLESFLFLIGVDFGSFLESEKRLLIVLLEVFALFL